MISRPHDPTVSGRPVDGPATLPWVALTEPLRNAIQDTSETWEPFTTFCQNRNTLPGSLGNGIQSASVVYLDPEPRMRGHEFHEPLLDGLVIDNRIMAQ
jgi:hypothetical protein